MAYQVSPGIISTEIDQTNIVPATSTAIAGYAGHFNWGPVEEINSVGSEKELIQIFGLPSNSNTRSFLTASTFLKYSNSLKVSRACSSSARNAANISPVLIKNKDHFDALSNINFMFSARYPGAIGNSLTVSFAHVGAKPTDTVGFANALAAYNAWPYANLFDTYPNTSLTGAESSLLSNDEIHLVVIDTLGLVSGTKGSILERYEGLSLGSNARNENGASIFYKDVINTNSALIFVNTLSQVFPAADTEIIDGKSFAATGTDTPNSASVNVKFLQNTETVVIFSGGGQTTNTVQTTENVNIFAGLTGAAGNNTQLIFKLTSVASIVKRNRGFIRFGVPAIGDTVIVNGVTFTRATAVGSFAFTDLNSLVNQITLEVPAISSAVTNTRGTSVLLTQDITVNNPVTLVLGSQNTGTMRISGPTLAGIAQTGSDTFVETNINGVDPLNGFVSFEIRVGVAPVTTNGVTVNKTKVTLKDIIREVKFAIEVHATDNVQLPVFPLSENSPQASMVLDVQTLFPYTLSNQVNLKVMPFVGGQVSLFTANTLLNYSTLSGGLDGSIAPQNVVAAIEMFRDKDLVDINFLYSEVFDTEVNQAIVDSAVYSVANSRADILGAISSPIGVAKLTSNALKKNAVIAKFDQPMYSSSSYITFGQTPVYMYNRYNDTYIWVPEAGHILGLCANTDLVADPWFSPAGFNRGQLKGVTKIAFNPSQNDRDDLYKKRINSIISVPGEGVILFGDKTALSKSSAFSHINVRRLFNLLKRSISSAAKYQLFELNDEFTRASFKNTVEPFLRNVQGRRGIIDFRVKCDEFNNTGEVIDAGNFIGDIFIKPSRSINTIQLNFIATRTGVDFKEIVGS